jgi:hypothetical protein
MLRSLQKLHWLWLVPVLLTLTALASSRLNADPLWYDEWYSLYYAGAAPLYGPITPAEVIARIDPQVEFNPPGYYLLLHIWTGLAGGSAFSGRALSLLLGILTAALVYRLGCDLDGRRAGWGAVLTLGASAFFISQLHELRAYTLFPLLVTLTIWEYWCFTQSTDLHPVRFAAAYALGLTALLYTHYMAIPLVAALAVYHLALAPKGRRWWVVLGLSALAGLAFLPWLGVSLQATASVTGDASRDFYAQSASALVGNLLNQFTSGSPALLVIVAVYARRGRAAHLVWMLILVGVAVVLVVNQQLRFIGIARYLVGFWPLLALLAGLGLAAMSRARLRPIVILAIWLLGGAGLILSRALTPDGVDPGWKVYLPWDKLAAALQPYAVPGDTLLVLLPEPTPFWFHAPLAAHYLAALNPRVQPIPDWLPAALFDGRMTPAVEGWAGGEATILNVHLLESLYGTTPEQFHTQTSALLSESAHFWTAYYPDQLPSPFLRPVLDRSAAEQGFIACGSILAEPTLRLDLQVKLPTVPEGNRFGDGIILDVLTPLPAAAEDRLPLVIGSWLREGVPPGIYSVGVHLLDSNGSLAAQSDFALPDALQGCHPVSLSLEPLLSGTYWLALVVYDWQTGSHLPVAGSTDSYIVGIVEVLN